MRSKEVDLAIADLKLQIENEKEELPYSEECLKNKETVLNYISELEKLPNKIRDKIKELEEEKNKVDDINRTFRIYTPYDSYDLQINILKELTEGE